MKFNCPSISRVTATAVLLACFVTGPALANRSAAPPTDAAAHADETSANAGVDLSAPRPSAAGFMIDLRLTVTDAEKAAPLFKRQVKPYLLHEESGMKVPVASSAKTGSLRFSGVVQEDRTYVMLFANPGRSLKVGHKVKLIVGDYSSEELVIQ